MLTVIDNQSVDSVGFVNTLSLDATVSSSNSMLVLSVASRVDGDTVTATFDGTPMVQEVDAFGSTSGVTIYYLYNPPTGTNTVNISSEEYNLYSMNVLVIEGESLTSTPIDSAQQSRYSFASGMLTANTDNCIVINAINTRNTQTLLRPKSGESLRYSGAHSDPSLGQFGVSTKLPTSMNTTIGWQWDTYDNYSQAYIVIEDNPTPVLGESENIVVITETRNTVGPDTDVQLGYRVLAEIYYSENDILVNDAGEVMVYDDGEEISVSVGAPMGVALFDGYIAGYDMQIGEVNKVRVELISNGAELANKIITDSGETTVAYLSQSPSDIIKSIVDLHGGTVTYSSDSIADTATSASYTFKVNTSLEGIEKCLELAPANWYWYVDPATNILYFNVEDTTADHTLILGRHISSLNVGATLNRMVNDVYFVGGDTGSGALYKRYQDATSQTNYGASLKVVKDLRVTVPGTADIIGGSKITTLKDPINTTEVRISIGAYDIHSIKLGHMVAFANTNSFIDDLLLQVVNISKTVTEATITLDLVEDSINKRVEDISRNQTQIYTENVPTSPS